MEKAILEHFGSGPLTDQLLACKRGEIGADVARDRLCRPEGVASISLEDFARLSDRCVRWAYRGHWEDAVTLHEWMAQVLMASGDRLAVYLPGFMLEDLRIATTALWHRPDPRLYRRTFAIAANMVEQGGISEKTRAKLAHEIGILHLDPYVANRATVADVKTWWAPHRALAAEAGCAMPEPEQALDLAEQWLRRSLKAAAGVERLESLKALLQVLYSRPILGGRVDPAAARPLLGEAIALLKQFPHRADIAGYLQQVGHALGEHTRIQDLGISPEDDWEGRIEQVGIDVVLASITSALGAAQDSDRAWGLRLARRLEPLVDTHAAEPARLSFHRRVLELLAGDDTRTLPEAQRSIDVLERIRTTRPDEPARTADIERLLGWLLACIRHDHDDDALKLLQGLQAVAPDLWQQRATSLDLLGAQLELNIAVNALNEGHVDEAVKHYFFAWGPMCRLGFDDTAVDLLGRMADLLPRCETRTVQVICELVRDHPGPLDPEHVEPWQLRCSELAAAATQALEAGGTADAWFAAARLAKGPTYASLLIHPRRFDWRADAEAVHELAAIRQVESGMDAASLKQKRVEAGLLFEEMLLSYRSTPLKTAGNTAMERRENLARELDLLVRRRLSALVAQHVHESAQEIQAERFGLDAAAACIPPDAVVLDVFLPHHGASLGYCLGFTNDTQKLLGVRGDEAGIRGVAMAGAAGEHEMTPSAMMAAATRRALMATPPDGEVVSAEARRLLDENARRFLGFAFEWLDEQRASGKKHLIVVTSGPLHFYPVHLLGVAGKVLADDWIVTYLPSVDLLRRVHTTPRPREGAAVFALSYAAAASGGAQALPNAIEEGRTVAQALKVALVPEAQATPRRGLPALQPARHVHIVCHGEHDVAAPSLQNLRLQPDLQVPDDDGRLYATDLLALDLQGLSVLSLSACETALGRFDLGDNLLGLAANALARGADCVVGTLWQAADDASAVFFGEFYKQVAAGATRRDAFRAAQLETRRQFEAYADWAPFYLCGAW